MGNRTSSHESTGRYPGRSIPEKVIQAIGTPLTRIVAPKLMFFGGNEYWKQAAGITGEPLYPPEHFEPQNYPRITQPEQGEQ